MKKTETKTEETMSPELEAIQGTRHPLAKVVPIDESRVDLFNPKRWTNEDIDTIKKTICPAGIPDADFKLFIMKCQASGMNPLLGEAFCIKRNQNIGSKDHPKWIEVFQFTPGEAGMEGRADDFPDYRGLRAAAVYENDKIIIDASEGEVSHQYNPVDPKRGRLLGAWAIAYRDGRKTPAEFVRLDEYIDTRNPKWASSPATMLVKCARAAALRRAYPNAFDGVFLREEIPEDGERTTGAEQTTGSQVEQANRSTTDVLADRMRATATAQAGLKTEAKPQSAKGATVDVVPQKAEPKPATEVKSSMTLSLGELKQELARAEILYDINQLERDPAYFATKLAAVLEHKAKRAAGVDKPPAPLPSQQADAKAAEEAAKGPLMTYGPKNKQPISSLEGPELLEMVEYGNAKLPALNEKQKAKCLATITDLRNEIQRRERAMLEAEEKPAREPGDDSEID